MVKGRRTNFFKHELSSMKLPYETLSSTVQIVEERSESSYSASNSSHEEVGQNTEPSQAISLISYHLSLEDSSRTFVQKVFASYNKNFKEVHHF